MLRKVGLALLDRHEATCLGSNGCLHGAACETCKLLDEVEQTLGELRPSVAS